MANMLAAKTQWKAWTRVATTCFNNVAMRELPVVTPSSSTPNGDVPNAVFARVTPTPIINPELVVASTPALELAGIQLHSNSASSDEQKPLDELVQVLAGNTLLEGSETAAQCYSGHQFGHFSGQLGDGAAIYLGEVDHGDKSRWEIQLKGAGLTPFSRTADGRKVLRSTIREFLASEHLHALGVPTTRAGAVVTSRDTQVVRDQFYDGNVQYEPTAVVLRLARTFLRFGSFENWKPTDGLTGRKGPSAHVENKAEEMTSLLEFCIREYYPSLYTDESMSKEDMYVEFFRQVVHKTAVLVAKWQAVGFCHGVLNTDNMSIVGDTLDYGPFGFMEHFNAEHICNTSDDGGRYRYENQPAICKWNCGVLADQLSLVVDGEKLRGVIDDFDNAFTEEYYGLMSRKLGLFQHSDPEVDRDLIDTLFDAFQTTGADYTSTFRALANVDTKGDDVLEELVKLSEDLSQVARRMPAFSNDQIDKVAAFLERHAEQAHKYGITQETVDEMKRQRDALTALRDSSEEDRQEHVRNAWAKWLDTYRTRLEKEGDAELRKKAMHQVNPRFILRNHVAQSAIDAATRGDYAHVEHILHLLMNPFDDGGEEDEVYARPQPSSEKPLCVSCSS